MSALRSQLQKATSRCHELLCERGRLERQLLAKDGQLRVLTLELEAARRDIVAAALQNVDQDVRQDVDGAEAGPSEVSGEASAAEIARLRAQVAALEGKLAAAPMGSGPSLADISGIGPTFQTRLAERGVDIAAVARWTDEDIVRFASQIGTQPGRIRRQAWVPQAQALIAAGSVD